MEMTEPKKAELTSIRLGTGKIPDKEEEVEQKLTITEAGSISFETFCFGEGFGRFKPGKRIHREIGQEAGQMLLRKLVPLCHRSDDTEPEMADMKEGFWTLRVEWQGKETEETSGVLSENAENGALSVYLRKCMQIDRCWLFGDAQEEAGIRDSAVTLDDFPKG